MDQSNHTREHGYEDPSLANSLKKKVNFKLGSTVDTTFSNPEDCDEKPQLITAQVHQNHGSMETNEQPLAESPRKETQPPPIPEKLSKNSKPVGILTTRPQLTKRVKRMTGYIEMKPVRASSKSTKLKARPPPPILTPLLDQ